MAIVRKNLNDIVVSKPSFNRALYESTTDEITAKQRAAEGYTVDLTEKWKIIDNKTNFNHQKSLTKLK